MSAKWREIHVVNWRAFGREVHVAGKSGSERVPRPEVHVGKTVNLVGRVTDLAEEGQRTGCDGKGAGLGGMVN